MKKNTFAILLTMVLLVCLTAWATTKLRNVIIYNSTIQLGASGTMLTGSQGNSGIVQQAGTLSGSSVTLCTDANGNTTTSGCRFIQVINYTSGCTTNAGMSYSTCQNTMSWPVAFVGTYVPVCQGVDPNVPQGNNSEGEGPVLTIFSFNNSNITVSTQTTRSASAHFPNILCIGVGTHP
jgi:hypothetical protein